MSQIVPNKNDDADKLKPKRVGKQLSKISINSESNEVAFKRVNDLKNLRVSTAKKSETRANVNKLRQTSADERVPPKTPESRSSTRLTMNSNEQEKIDKFEETNKSQDESDENDEVIRDNGQIQIDEETLKTIDFTLIDKSKRELERKRDIALKYLNSQKDLSLILDTQRGRDMLRFIHKLTFKIMKLIYYVIETTYYKQMIELLDYQYEKVIESLPNETLDEEEGPISETYTKLELLKTQLLTIMNMTNRSIDFCSSLHETNAIQTMLKYVTNDFFLSVLAGKREVSKKYSTLIKNLVRISLGSLHNMTKAKDKHIDEWNRSNAAKSLLVLSKRLGDEGVDNPSIRNSIYMTVANIAADNEIESLQDIQLVLKEIIYIISMCVKQLKKDPADIKRSKIQVEIDGVETSVHVLRFTYKLTTWHCVELLNSVYNLALCDKIKNDVYFTFNMNDHLRTIIYNGNHVEIQHGLKLLYQLCFEKKICEHVKNDQELIAKIKELNISETKNGSTKKFCQGILWLMDDNSNKSETDSIKSKTTASESDKHIMISYNRESRELCMKIKSELEKMNYKVWIDVENIHGSSLESMALAIENSMCVLMCMTEKYKQSPNCRAEAEYAFNLHKPIIPLIMQKDYQPSGWLGIILGSKIFVHFMKYDFEECIRRLREEILNINSIKKPNASSIASPNLKVIVQKSSAIIMWAESDVEKWIINKNINISILNDLKPCDGKILNQLYKILTTAPEFFYCALTAKNSISLRDVAVFTSELEALFKD